MGLFELNHLVTENHLWFSLRNHLKHQRKNERKKEKEVSLKYFRDTPKHENFQTEILELNSLFLLPFSKI